MKVNKLNKLTELVHKYEQNITNYRNESYNETELRNDFLNPLLEILDWDVFNKKSLSQYQREVSHEFQVDVVEGKAIKRKRPDYCIRLGNYNKFFIEAKKPSVNILSDKKAAFQVRRYGWSANMKISILTNFENLVIYDCSVKPDINDDTKIARIYVYSYSEYIEKFDEIYELISRETVHDGTFDIKFKNINSVNEKEPFDDYFLNQIEAWRNNIALDIIKNNEDVSDHDLNYFIQRFINKIIFLRICEDKNIEKYETLKKIASLEELKKLFKIADKKYNSGIFELVQDNTFNSLKISDDVIVGIFKDLYYPNSSYAFDVVDPHILGEIYEVFLGKVIKKDGKNSIVIDYKEEIIESKGVITTPKHISDYIVGQTLDPMFLGKEIEDIKNITVGDICCGSGIFLLSAYEYIINFYEEKSASNKITFKEKREILTKHIFGVDIDSQAIEVAKFSLLIKLLENIDVDEIAQYNIENNGSILPALDNNIRNGNSLISIDEYSSFNEAIDEDFNLLKEIKPFNWDKLFKYTGTKGFDCIIGNPPYINVQNMNKYSKNEYEYIKSDKSKYTTSKEDNIDKYFLFIERSLNMLSQNGRLGYIVPNKFFITTAGKNLRKLISDKRCLSYITNFGINSVFEGRSTYTCIINLVNKPQKEVKVGRVSDYNKWKNDYIIEYKKYPIDYITEDKWIFGLDEETIKIKEKITNGNKPLSEYTDIMVGLQTSKDTFYIIEEKKPEELDKYDENYVYFEDALGRARKIERGILRKCINDLQINMYEKIKNNRYIIFPYKEVIKYRGRDKAVLYSLDEIKNLYPYLYGYLLDFKSELKSRKMKDVDETNWYQFGRSQSLTKFNGEEKLVWPVLSNEPKYVYDNDNIMFTGGGNGPYYGLKMKKGCKLSIFYIQAILSHPLIELIVKSGSSEFRGGYYSHGKQYISYIPIKDIDENNSIELGYYNDIIDKVKKIHKLAENKKYTRLRDEDALIEEQIKSIRGKIDSYIEKLYGIEKEELKNILN